MKEFWWFTLISFQAIPIHFESKPNMTKPTNYSHEKLWNISEYVFSNGVIRVLIW